MSLAARPSRAHTNPLRAAWSLALALAALAAPGAARAQVANRLWIPDAQLTVGDPDSSIDVLCDHDFDLVGYSLYLGYDPAKVRITAANKGGDVEGLDFLFFSADITSEADRVFVGAIFRVDETVTTVLSPGTGHSLLTLGLDDLAAPGETVELTFQEDPDPASARKNRLSAACPDPDDPCTPLLPALQNGSVVALFGNQITVYAGPDRLGAENEAIELSAAAWSPDPSRPLSFQWSQLSGPDVVNPLGASTSSYGFTLPPVISDTTIVLQLAVSDTVLTGTDLVVVDVVDLDLRQASVAVPASEARILDDGRRAVAYAGQIAWDSTAEDAIWTDVAFSARASPGSSSAIDGATLYIDRNGDGLPGAEDTQLGSAPIDGDSALLAFQFSEPLSDGDRPVLLLVVDLIDGGFRSAGPWVLAVLVALSVAGAGALGRLGGARRVCGLRGALAIGSLAVLPLACKSGGGGGGGPSVSPTREIHFELDPSSLVIHGTTTGVSIPVSGGIQRGPSLEF